ncbi:Hsp70 family protein [Longispora albida]|uniref:Hsp70 family protein n=1 Tax=Longispora albida TaxID=203523 RepID=UPI00039B581D|nr:Hsp70 family protein [Longispora albida]
MRALAIDFGTSNTVAMLRTPDGRVRPLLFDGSPLLPSAVYLQPDGRITVGKDAERSARLDPSRFEPNPKRRIDDGSIFLGDQEIPVPRVMAYVLEQVVTETRRQLGAAPERVLMTHPARWGEQRRRLLVEASRIAGLPQPQLIPEPVGAASYFTAVLGSGVPVGRSLAIYDLGGGTFDATVVRRTQTGFEVLAEEGLPDIGGVDFDHAVIEHLGSTYEASHAEKWKRLITPQDPGDRRQRRMLYEDVRGAKEMLSRTSAADIHLPALDVDAHLTREELEALIRPYLERTVECLSRTVTSARLTPRDLVGIFLVGGSSRIPLAAHLIHSELGVAPTTLEQPETVVVEGALCVGGAPTSGFRPQSGAPRQVMPQAQRVAPAVPPRLMPPQGRPMQPQQQVQRPMGPPQPQQQQRPPVAPPRPPVMAPQPPRPQMQPQQQVQRPVSPPPPVQQRPPVAPPRPPVMAPRPQPVQPPRPQPQPVRPPVMAPQPVPVAEEKRWYKEPGPVVLVAVSGILVLFFIGLLAWVIGK